MLVLRYVKPQPDPPVFICITAPTISILLEILQGHTLAI